MKKMKVTHFSCVSCDKVKRIEERHIVNAAYICWDGSAISQDEEGELLSFHYRVPLCDACYHVPKKAKKKGAI